MSERQISEICEGEINECNRNDSAFFYVLDFIQPRSSFLKQL